MDIKTKYQNLCSWLNQNGSWVNPKMEIRSEGENGNGIWTRESITNEDLFNISDNCLLNAENSGLTFLDPNFLDHRQKTVVALKMLILNIKSSEKNLRCIELQMVFY